MFSRGIHTFLEYVHMRGEINSNPREISFQLKIHFCVQSALYLCSYELRWNETQKWYGLHIGHFDQNENSLPGTKWISADLLDVALNAHITQCRYGFHIGHFETQISYCVIKYHVKTNGNGMPAHVHQNIRSFWNAAEMKFHVNRTCFHAGLKFQTGISWFCLSCERTLLIQAYICNSLKC